MVTEPTNQSSIPLVRPDPDPPKGTHPKVKVSTHWESNIRVKEQLYRKGVFYAFEQNWKIGTLKRDNGKYINVIFLSFLVSVFVLFDF